MAWKLTKKITKRCEEQGCDGPKDIESAKSSYMKKLWPSLKHSQSQEISKMNHANENKSQDNEEVPNHIQDYLLQYYMKSKLKGCDNESNMGVREVDMSPDHTPSHSAQNTWSRSSIKNNMFMNMYGILLIC